MKQTTTNVEPICPECRAGKHANCDGKAWDDTADCLTVCRCWAAVRHTR